MVDGAGRNVRMVLSVGDVQSVSSVGAMRVLGVSSAWAAGLCGSVLWTMRAALCASMA